MNMYRYKFLAGIVRSHQSIDFKIVCFGSKNAINMQHQTGRNHYNSQRVSTLEILFAFPGWTRLTLRLVCDLLLAR